MKLQNKCFDNKFTQNHTKFYLTFKKSPKTNFFETFASWEPKNSKTFKT